MSISKKQYKTDALTHNFYNVYPTNNKTETYRLEITQVLDAICHKLKLFIRPTIYDGSDAICASLYKALSSLKASLEKKYHTAQPAHIQDIDNRLLEVIYFHYKCAQKNTLKITYSLQKILITLLKITRDRVSRELLNHQSLAKYTLTKKALLNLVKDNVIEASFWKQVGPEAHISLRLLDAKRYQARPENKFIRRQIVEMHQQNQPEIILQITEALSAIRMNTKLSHYERHQKMITLLHKYQSKSIGNSASKLDSLLIEAEKHVNDYFKVAMVQC